MTKTMMLSERDAWTAEGHASEAALVLLIEEGHDHLVPGELLAHVAECDHCGAAMADATMLREATGTLLRKHAATAVEGARARIPLVPSLAAAAFVVIFTLAEISPGARATFASRGADDAFGADAAILARHVARLATHAGEFELVPVVSSLALCGLAMVLLATRARWARSSSLKGVS